MNPEPTKSGAEPKAHQPDGTDSSAEFAAQIAHENTIPDTLPELDEG